MKRQKADTADDCGDNCMVMIDNATYIDDYTNDDTDDDTFYVIDIDDDTNDHIDKDTNDNTSYVIDIDDDTKDDTEDGIDTDDNTQDTAGCTAFNWLEEFQSCFLLSGYNRFIN